jgi:SulP family sulfate permease
MTLRNLRQEWFSNIRGDVLAGIVVALALIPEAIAFSIIAGVDPKVGLYASFCIAATLAITGGRVGMISGATGSVALLMVTLVKDHGLQYLLVATLLTGVLQILAGVFKLNILMRFVSRSVVTGFVNALAILIFMAQLPELIGAQWQVYALVVAGLVIIYGVPRFTKVIPSPLICIVVLTAFTLVAGVHVRTVADMGKLPDSLPIFLLPQVPFNWHTLMVVLPYSVTMMVVGLLESMMTASVVDDFTDTVGNKRRECMGLGAANIVSGLFGGMAGCAMIGQSVINVKSGGRGRLSTFCSGVFLLIMVVFAKEWVGRIPMAALVAVMIMVSIGTFSWSSLKNLRLHPKSSSVVMIATVVVVVATDDLSKGVIVGVLLSALFFARKVGRVMHVTSALNADERIREYRVTGQVFFASAETFIAAFDFREAIDQVRIDVSRAHFWDLSAVGALDKVVIKFRREGTTVDIHGLNEASAMIVDRLAIHDKPDAIESLMGH